MAEVVKEFNTAELSVATLWRNLIRISLETFVLFLSKSFHMLSLLLISAALLIKHS